MKFKFGAHGFSELALTTASTPILVLRGGVSFFEMKFRDNFVEFSAKGFWDGMEVVNEIAESLATLYPDTFNGNKTAIWVDDEQLDICLLSKVQLAEKAMIEATQLLRQGRSKRFEKSNELSRSARLKLERALRTLQLR